MKTLRNSNSQNENKNSISWFQKDFTPAILIAKKVLFMIFVLFAFHAVSVAQTSMAPNMDNSIRIDKQEVKENKAALRAEREEKAEVRELKDIPEATMNLFKTQFPKATDVSWMVPDDYIEAQFKEGTKSKVAFYNWENELLGSGRYVDYAKLPESARKFIAKHDKGYVPVKAMWYDDDEENDEPLNLWGTTFDQDSYFVQLKKGDKMEVLQVDMDGEVNYWGGE